jgi:hypothetical protein
MIRELSALPEDAWSASTTPTRCTPQRRLKELFVDICTPIRARTWSGYERYLGQLKQRRKCRRSCAPPVAAPPPHRGPIKDPDLNAEGVIALAIIFASKAAGRIVARTGQKEFERFVKSVRKNKPDFEAGWAALMAEADRRPTAATAR